MDDTFAQDGHLLLFLVEFYLEKLRNASPYHMTLCLRHANLSNLTTYNAWSCIYISIFVCPVIDTTLLYVSTLWLSIFY